MNNHTLGISGSTILSNPDKFPLLFDYDPIHHIEIGEFPSEEDFIDFLKQVNNHQLTFGLHSPLLRNKSKYDLLERVQYKPEEAWKQFEEEVRYMSEIGAEYVLVHFPYFRKETDKNTNVAIERGLKKLSSLQQQYKIPIVCEPKLGHNRSAVGIEALDKFSVEIWDKYDISLCIDIGDYLMAKGDQAIDYIRKWRRHIKVVHLHHVEYRDEKYFWVPVHPSYESNQDFFNVKKIIKQLAESREVYFVLEHTPHTNPTTSFVNESIEWTKEMINS